MASWRRLVEFIWLEEMTKDLEDNTERLRKSYGPVWQSHSATQSPSFSDSHTPIKVVENRAWELYFYNQVCWFHSFELYHPWNQWTLIMQNWIITNRTVWSFKCVYVQNMFTNHLFNLYVKVRQENLYLYKKVNVAITWNASLIQSIHC